MSQLANVASDCSVDSTEKLGINPDWVEAVAFAWMAKQTMAGRAIDTSAFTGATSPIILGGIYKA
jgi:anhydro-N-acetylmuramic acid kinase